MIEGGRSRSRKRRTRSYSPRRSPSYRRQSRRLRKALRSIVRRYSPRRTPYYLRTHSIVHARSPRIRYIVVPQQQQHVRAWSPVQAGVPSQPVFRPPTEGQLRAQRSAMRLKAEKAAASAPKT